MHGVLLAANGRVCYEVAEILGHFPTTIESWVHLFNDRGFEGLHDESRPGRLSGISDSMVEEIDKDLRKNPKEFGYPQNLWDGKLLSHHLHEKYSLVNGVRQAQRLFHKLGFRQRKSRFVISRAILSLKNPLKLIALSKEDDADIWSVDECHFQQHGSRCIMGIPPEEKDPIVLQEPTRFHIRVFGGVNVGTGRLVHQMSETFNAVTFLDFLKKLLSFRLFSKVIHLILDNSRYHHAKLLEPWLDKHRKEIVLDFLPPYALN